MLSARNNYQTLAEIWVYCPSGNKYGSGFVVTPKHIITAKHVVQCKQEDETPTLIMASLGSRKYSNRMFIDKEVPNKDIVRLVVAGIPNIFLYTATPSYRRVRVGELLCVITGQHVKKCGYVTSFDTKQIVLALKVVGGNSGSPAFDSKNYVVGMVIAGTMEPAIEDIAILLGPEALKSAIEDARGFSYDMSQEPLKVNHQKNLP